MIHGKPHEIPSFCQHFSKVKSHCSLWRVWKTTKIVPPLEIKRGRPLGNPLWSWASIYLSICLSIYLIYLSSYLSIYLIYLSHPSIHPSIYPSIYLSVCPNKYTVYSCIHLWEPLVVFSDKNRRIVSGSFSVLSVPSFVPQMKISEVALVSLDPVWSTDPINRNVPGPHFGASKVPEWVMLWSFFLIINGLVYRKKK